MGNGIEKLWVFEWEWDITYLYIPRLIFYEVMMV